MSAQPRPGRLVLLGHPVAHSLSPVFQQAALDHCGIALRYEAVDVTAERFAALIKTLRDQRAAGNVTLPHKSLMRMQCDGVTPVAARADAVNTFWLDADGSLRGDNTDVGGFTLAAQRLFGSTPSGCRVIMLGAGGGAAGVVEALRDWPGASLVVHARSPAQSKKLAAALGARGRFTDGSESALHDALGEADLVVNATSQGIEGQDALPVATADLPSRVAVLDLTYRKAGLTPWVAECRARGLRADDGLTMLVEQGALAFERWFGIEAPREVMRAAVGR